MPICWATKAEPQIIAISSSNSSYLKTPMPLGFDPLVVFITMPYFFNSFTIPSPIASPISQ